MKRLLYLTVAALITGAFTGCTPFKEGDSPATSTASAVSSSPDTQGGVTEDAHLANAREALSAGDYSKAVRESDASIAAHADSAEAYSIRGLAEALQGDMDKGLEDTKTSYELDPRSATNYYNMAMVYKLQGRLNESKEWFEKVLETDPRNTWSVYGIATIYADQGDDAKALDWLERAIKIDPAVKAVAAEQDHFMKYHGQARFDALVR